MSDGADSSDDDVGALAAGAGVGAVGAAAAYGGKDPYHMDGVRSASAYTTNTSGAGTYADYENPAQQTAPVQTQSYTLPTQPAQPVNQQQPTSSSFLGGGDLDRHNSSYGDWMAPAAAGVAGAGIGAVGADAYRRHQQDAVVPQTDAIDHANVAAVEANKEVVPPTSAASTTGVADVAANPLGGHEREGAHETGQFFPQVVRHDTDISVSRLHVPGQYPRQASSRK